MEIKTSEEIESKLIDLQECNQHLLIDFSAERWVKVEDVKKKIQAIKEMKIDAEDFVQELGLIDGEKRK